ncbi:MAG: PTS-dependent dihydroxyacetone kinase phosphotransferase subunit DhaM [Eubacterium sp.]|nr:PTS-dependent dihydroxyacetone kinase phosphotransferase subunit DhaM [Eubacterium sp.]
MVGIVVVSHSKHLAESIVELTKMMADSAQVVAAGGLEDGTFGTSFDRIKAAIDEVYSEDGVIVLMDMGSAVMTTEMVIETYETDKIRMVDAPIVESAVAASVSAMCGSDLETILEEIEETKNTPKF